MFRAFAILTVLAACGGAAKPVAPAEPPPDYHAMVVHDHERMVASLQEKCDAGDKVQCGYLGYQYVVPYEHRYGTDTITDDTFKLDPDKGWPMMDDGCTALLVDAKKSHEINEGDANLCAKVLERPGLDPKHGAQIGGTLCELETAYCDRAEAAFHKAGDEAGAKSAHALWAGWYCLTYSDRVSEYSSQDQVDKVQKACDDAKADGGGGAGADGCHKDTDCKGDRVCEDGTCKAPAKK
jgi:hypothetical protein